jgi:hypothetical protein
VHLLWLTTVTVVCCLPNCSLLAQTPSILSDPKLSANSGLPLYNPPGPTLSQLLGDARATAPSKGISWKGLDVTIYDDAVLSPTVPVETFLMQLYAEQACQADTIVVGHLDSSAYHLSTSGTMVYGDHLLMVDTLLKKSASASLLSQVNLVVTRPGGSLSMAEGVVKVDYRAVPDLQSGQSYLIFLKYLPASGAYQAIDAFSTLVASGGKWIIAWKTFSTIALPGFARGSLEPTILGKWLASCK